MALKIHKRLLKSISSPLAEFVGAYLRSLEGYAASLGLQSSLWQLSGAALSDPRKGHISAGSFLDQCDEHILHTPGVRGNSVTAIWTLRNDKEEHSFKLKLVLSQIPHFWVDFLESSYEAGACEALSSQDQKRMVIKHGLADVVLTKDDLLGQPDWLYLYLKIVRSKTLLERFRHSAWDGKDIVGEIAEAVKRELATTTAEPLALRRKECDGFLRRCDERLITSLGADQFGALISKAGLSSS